MSGPRLIFSQSHYLILLVDTNSHSQWQTVQIQISWLPHCFQRQDISGISRTRVKLINAIITCSLQTDVDLDLEYLTRICTVSHLVKTFSHITRPCRHYICAKAVRCNCLFSLSFFTYIHLCRRTLAVDQRQGRHYFHTGRMETKSPGKRYKLKPICLLFMIYLLTFWWVIVFVQTVFM